MSEKVEENVQECVNLAAVREVDIDVVEREFKQGLDDLDRLRAMLEDDS